MVYEVAGEVVVVVGCFFWVAYLDVNVYDGVFGVGVDDGPVDSGVGGPCEPELVAGDVVDEDWLDFGDVGGCFD